MKESFEAILNERETMGLKKVMLVFWTLKTMFICVPISIKQTTNKPIFIKHCLNFYAFYDLCENITKK